MYSTWFKNWLINFWVFVHYSICYFSWCVNAESRGNFFWDMMDNNCSNIFSTWFEFKHHLFMGHIVSNLHLLNERIFVFMCNLIFLVWLCFYFSSPPIFSPKLVLFFLYFYMGRMLFLKPMLFIGGVLAIHRGSWLYFL